MKKYKKKCKWCKKMFTFESYPEFVEGRKYCCDEHYELGMKRQLERKFKGLSKGRK